MSSYTRDQNKITIYFDGHDYYNVPTLGLRAVEYLKDKKTKDALLTYGDDEVHMYVKKNKHGYTVRQLNFYD